MPTGGPHLRQPRQPLAQSDFDKLPLRPRAYPAAAWSNLRWQNHATAASMFFASESGRLTPASKKVPCIYLAVTEGTSFLEIYGDRIFSDRAAGRTPRIEAADFDLRVFLQINAPELRLADLTSGPALEALHLDLGTLYAADLGFPRAFAEAIYRHPAGVDGIAYESRHTKEVCAVVWPGRNAGLQNLPFVERGTLGERATLNGSSAMLFGLEVEVVS